MLQADQAADHAKLAVTVYNEIKFWAPFAGGLWGLFKIVEWVKRIKTNDLHHLQLGLDELRKDVADQTVQINANLKDQTTAIVGELKELRGDMRSLTSAMIVPPRPQLVKSKSPRRKVK